MEDQVCAEGNDGAIDGQRVEVPALHCLHAGNEKFTGAITCHDFDDMTVRINSSPKLVRRSRRRSIAFYPWVRRIRHELSCLRVGERPLWTKLTSIQRKSQDAADLDRISVDNERLEAPPPELGLR